MRCVGTANRLCACLGKAEVAYLSGYYQIRHGADCFFNRSLRVDSVLIVEIDRVDAEPLQAGVAGSADVLRAAVHSARAIRLAHDTELGGDDDFVAMRFERAAYQLFIGVRAVHVRGIEEVDAEIERTEKRSE